MANEVRAASPHSPPPGVREILGVPVLPPAAVTRATQRLRAGLARLRRAPAPPPVRILEGLLGALDLAALVALCRTRVPERLTTPMDIESLAADLAVDLDRLERLLRYATVRGWVRMDRRGRFRPTPVLAFLRAEHPGGWRAWVEFMGGEEVLAALGRLDDGMTADGDPFASATGTPFFDWLREHPSRHASFDAAMEAGGRMHGLVLARRLDWSAFRRVCDVGGGTGALLSTLLAAHPGLEGVLLELPQVAARAPAVERMTVVAGDAFEAVPEGCDTYLLVNVLHDWDDPDARRLLGTVAAALRGGGGSGTAPRMVVVEGGVAARPRDDVSILTDLLMFALTAGGRERTRAELSGLAASVGLRLQRTLHLPSAAVATVLSPVDTP
jgi:hypothetical protein